MTLQPPNSQQILPARREMVIFGIDPGLDGAVALISETMAIWDTPTVTVKDARHPRRHFNLPEMTAILERAVYGSEAHIFIEAVHSMPSQGVASSFQFGMGFGMWQGIIAALKIPMTLVPPQRWKKHMLAGLGADKNVARLRAQQLFPSQAHCFNRAKDDGRAEALLIAAWGARELKGNSREG